MAIEVKDRAEQVDPSRMVLGKNSRQRKKILPRSKKGIAILIIILFLLVSVLATALYYYNNRSSDAPVDPKDQMSEEMNLLKDYKPRPTEDLRYEFK